MLMVVNIVTENLYFTGVFTFRLAMYIISSNAQTFSGTGKLHYI